MNFKILLLIISVAAISSCSTAYKNGQTPDDVYYSPVRVVEEDYRQEKKEVQNTNPEDRQIRMAVYDRRWRNFDDDFNYRYDPYTYGYSYGYYYNPYYCYYPVYITNVYISNPKNTVPRMTNLGSYNNTSYELLNTKYTPSTRQVTRRTYNNSNDNSNIIRRILSSPENNSGNSGNNNTRSYTPSSSGSSSGSSSSGSSGSSVTRPGRAN